MASRKKIKKVLPAIDLDEIRPQGALSVVEQPTFPEVGTDKSEDAPGPTVTNSKGKEISDDIEKDVNIDVHINNNTACRIQHISNITINYYNNDDNLRRTNVKNQT